MVAHNVGLPLQANPWAKKNCIQSLYIYIYKLSKQGRNGPIIFINSYLKYKKYEIQQLEQKVKGHETPRSYRDYDEP